jgi:hypothetical protein
MYCTTATFGCASILTTFGWELKKKILLKPEPKAEWLLVLTNEPRLIARTVTSTPQKTPESITVGGSVGPASVTIGLERPPDP